MNLSGTRTRIFRLKDFRIEIHIYTKDIMEDGQFPYIKKIIVSQSFAAKITRIPFDIHDYEIVRGDSLRELFGEIRITVAGLIDPNVKRVRKKFQKAISSDSTNLTVEKLREHWKLFNLDQVNPKAEFFGNFALPRQDYDKD